MRVKVFSENHGTVPMVAKNQKLKLFFSCMFVCLYFCVLFLDIVFYIFIAEIFFKGVKQKLALVHVTGNKSVVDGR